jgi:MarR family transcriptional regulator, organic hydroperoxide resistance regulator
MSAPQGRSGATEERGPAGEPSLAREAWGLLLELTMSERRRFMAAVAEHDLSMMQSHVLRLLEPGQAQPMSALAEALCCDASNVTGIADRLESRGLVERRPAEHDRRVKALAVTAAGAEIRDRLLERMTTPPERIAALPAEDQRALRDALLRALDR